MKNLLELDHSAPRRRSPLRRGAATTVACAVLAVGALSAGTLAAVAQDAPAPGRSTSVPLSPDAPSTYVVARGDTLWDISRRFLREPWFWPEIWYLNPEIRNPHLIYPGDTLRLVFDASGRPQIRVERGDTVRLTPQVRSTPLDQAIPAIPYEVVAAFMSKPSVLAKDEADRLPYIVALRDSRVIGAMSDQVYARGIDGAVPGTRYNVVRLGNPLRDPDGGGFLGYEGVYAAAVRVDRATTGEGRDALARLSIVESTRETQQGDRLVSERLEVPLDFVPHAPSQQVDGRIISVVDGIAVVGQYQVVVVNRGREHGLEPGNVLSIWQRGERVRDAGPNQPPSLWSEFRNPFPPRVRLPEERSGTFMVFRTYDRMSYGLVMEASAGIRVGDAVRNP